MNDVSRIVESAEELADPVILPVGAYVSEDTSASNGILFYELFPKGQEPVTEWEYTEKDDPKWGTVLPQDFNNMAAVQQGLKNGGFRGALLNPYRERSITNTHRTWRDMSARGRRARFSVSRRRGEGSERP
jgi:hypothetical protein